jgi:hypothetical protein
MLSSMVNRRRALHGLLAAALLLTAALLTLGPLAAEARSQAAVKLTKEWTGSVADAKLRKDAPKVINSAKALEKLWKDWKIEGKVPEVDFAKEIVIIDTTDGGKVVGSIANMDAQGALRFGALSTNDTKPGFRYLIATVSKEGVKTVNGKEPPKE